MHFSRNALAVAVLFSLAPAAAQSPSVQVPSAEPSDAPPAPMRVTTDTPEYCEHLADRVAQAEHAKPQTPPLVEELAEEGHHMCAAGLIRGGLVRLRRALMMLRAEK
jgi:hypothetical protein